MNRPNGDLIGNGMVPYGGGWPSQFAFGQDAQQAQMAAAQQFQLQGTPFNAGFCGGPPAQYDPAILGSKILAANSLIVGQECYGQEVTVPLGFQTTGGGTRAVAAGASATFQALPQLTCKPMRLVIPSSIASSFEIISIRVGQVEQIAGGTLPALMFIESATYVKLNFSTISINQPLLITVLNTSTADVDYFTGGLMVAGVLGGGPVIYGPGGGT